MYLAQIQNFIFSQKRKHHFTSPLSSTQALPRTFIQQRIRDHPNNFLKEEPSGTLWCEACCTDLCYHKKSTVNNHVASLHHIQACLAANARKTRIQGVYDYIKLAQRAAAAGEGPVPHGATLSLDQQAGRNELARAVLTGGIKMALVDTDICGLNRLLEMAIGQYNVDALRRQIPVLQEMELDLLCKELQSGKFCVGDPLAGHRDR